jgi:RHS repeat-associated protein
MGQAGTYHLSVLGQLYSLDSSLPLCVPWKAVSPARSARQGRKPQLQGVKIVPSVKRSPFPTPRRVEGLTGASEIQYTWDRRGNLLSDGTRQFTYDAAKQLLAVDDGTHLTNFSYNGDGVRVGKTVGGETTGYVVDTNTSLPVVLVEETAGQETAYLYGLDLLAQQGAGGAPWVYRHADGLGNTRLQTDPLGQVVASYNYDPFGVLRGGGVPDPGAFLFAGQQYDPSASLYYLRARYYDPALGRFLTRDPFPGLPTLPQTLNPYAYALNNPVNLVDPSGRFPWIMLLLAAGVGAYVAADNYTPVDPCISLLHDPGFWKAVGIGATVGASAFLGGWAVQAMLPILIPGIANAGLVGTMAAWALSGAAEGVAGQITYNVLTGAPPGHNVGQAAAIAAVAGAAVGVVGYGIRRVISQPGIAYRNPGTGQHPGALTQGFRPQNPNADYSVAYHVSPGRYKRPTQYLSLTKDLDVARQYQTPGVPVYVIDLQRVQGTVIDLTDDVVRNRLLLNPRTNAFARAAAEVLVDGWIPPDAILRTIP